MTEQLGGRGWRISHSQRIVCPRAPHYLDCLKVENNPGTVQSVSSRYVPGGVAKLWVYEAEASYWVIFSHSTRVSDIMFVHHRSYLSTAVTAVIWGPMIHGSMIMVAGSRCGGPWSMDGIFR